jgi:hypothetical protein
VQSASWPRQCSGNATWPFISPQHGVPCQSALSPPTTSSGADSTMPNHLPNHTESTWLLTPGLAMMVEQESDDAFGSALATPQVTMLGA